MREKEGTDRQRFQYKDFREREREKHGEGKGKDSERGKERN